MSSLVISIQLPKKMAKRLLLMLMMALMSLCDGSEVILFSVFLFVGGITG